MTTQTMIPAQQDTTTTSNVHSDVERAPMGEIETLTQRVQELGNSAGLWTSWGQWLTGIAAVAALLYFVTSTIALKRANSLSEAQATLAEAKDKVFALQLAEAKTAQLQVEAGLEEARSQTASANEAAAKAHVGLAKANLDIEARKQETLQLQTVLEREQIRRAQLVESVLWRNARIDVRDDWWRERLDESREFARRTDPDNPNLPGIPTIKFSIVYAKQLEPMWVAHDIAESLPASGFELTELAVADEVLRLGITIERAVGAADRDDFRSEAADAIVAALKQNFVMARTYPAKLPPNTLRILVGPSDRLSGQMAWQLGDDVTAGVPLVLPPPVRMENEKGEVVEFDFAVGKQVPISSSRGLQLPPGFKIGPPVDLPKAPAADAPDAEPSEPPQSDASSNTQQ